MVQDRTARQPSWPKLTVRREVAAEQIKFQIARGYEIKGLSVNSEQDWERAQTEESTWSGYNIGVLDRIFDSSSITDEYIRLHTNFVSEDAPLTHRVQEFRRGIDSAVGKLEYILSSLESIPIRSSFAYRIFLASIISFIVLFLVGLVQGYGIRKSHDYLITFVKDKIDLKKEHDGSIYITYTCYKIPYKYNIDNNIVQKLSNTDLSNLPESPSVLALLLGDDTIIKILLGGMTVYSFKDTLNFIIGKEPELNPRSIVIIITTQLASAVSGYALGYWAAIAYPPKCNSPRVLALLDDPVEWKRFERQIWQVSRGKVDQDLLLLEEKKIQDPFLNQAITKIGQIKGYTANIQHDFTTRDFKALEEVAKLRNLLWRKYM